MNFEINPKELNLQDAAGMQLAELIRRVADEAGTTDYEELSNLPKINGVTLVGDKSSDDLHIAVSDEQVADAVDAWLEDNVDPETGYVLDSTLTMSNAAAPADKVGELKSDISDVEDALDLEVTRQLFNGELSTTYLWNCWTATVSKEANSDYFCFEFDIPSGTEYITTNYNWPENSFSAFVNDSMAKIELIKNCRQTDSGYVYSVPVGTTKACVSVPNSSTEEAETRGIVFLVGTDDITSKTKTDYPYDGTKTYYADLLNLHSGGTVADFEAEVNDFGFEKVKNLVGELNEGEYSIAWNVGDTVTTASNDIYAYGIADVEGCEYVTINLPNISDSYSFFTDASRKKISGIASTQVDSSRVYGVPSGAKYLYISSSDKTVWNVTGLVVLSGTDDISTNTADVTTFPYDTTVIFADNLKLSNGQTLEEISENTSKVFHVEKDGSGDYTSLVECVQEAVKYMNSVVYVGAGTWDIVDEFGSDYMNAVSNDPNTWGLVLKNRVHIICSSNSVITAKYEGNNTNVKTYFSAFNIGAYGFTLENANIETDNVRYTIHDDRGSGGGEGYRNRYINCSMKHTNGMYTDCIGGGLGTNGIIEILNCYFEGDEDATSLVYYHGNNYNGQTNAQCKLIVKGNYFAGLGTFGLVKYGDSTKVSTAFVSDNSVGSALFVDSGSYAPQNNMQMIEWNNVVRS